MSGYTKLFNSIITSTIWQESPVVCKVWITMLAIADRDGVIEGSIPGLAHLASVSVAEAAQAVDRFMAPDAYSRSPENEGRRVEAIAGGWRLINYEKYREKMSPEDIRERDRIRKQRYRDRQKAGLTSACPTLSGTKRDKSEMSAKSNTHKAESIKQKEETRANDTPDDFDGSEWALRTFKAYPTWGDPDALVTPPRLADAYMQTIETEAPSRGGVLGAAEWLLEVTEEFARQSIDKEPKFIMQLEKFLRQGYAEVKLPRKANKYIPSESDEECEKRLREENRDRRRAAREVAATV